ncbi:MAG: hypothetical protein HDT09_01410 [Bacteroidales bacterium]|nr:hypothetical protein [Bacteroidales bacterium]
MTTDQLNSLLTRLRTAPAPLSASDMAELEQAAAAYPYFPALKILLLKGEGENKDKLRRDVAMACTSERIMATAARWSGPADFYPPAPEAEEVPTEEVIDRFLNTYGNVTPREEAMLEKMIFNPTPDYGEMLAREEQENLPQPGDDVDPDSPEARLNAFILAQHPAAHPIAPEPEPPKSDPHTNPIPKPQPAEDASLSESLALLFIKRGRYERAFEIISGLSLKFPKKSAYFADQLRFLQILIKNERLSKLSKPDAHNENN